ncbi:MAG: glycosyltransferase, partial [Hyphomicrobium sp.]
AHLHDPELLPLGFVLKALGYKVVYDVHEDLHLQIMGKGWVPAWLRRPLGFMWKQLERAGLALFDGIAPATPHIATRFPGPKTALVQNFPIVGEFKGASLGSYGARQPVFAYLGGLTAERGAVEMVRAMGALPQSITAGLEIAGTLAPATLVHSVEHLDGWRRVRLLGQIGRDDASALLGRARAGLVLFHPLPNHLDAYPTKLFEYMSAGLPVIASDFPAWREIVARHQCGRLCDPLDTDAIADAMRWILDNPEEADYMGKRGRAAIDAHYSWDNEAARLVACYRRILAA